LNVFNQMAEMDRAVGIRQCAGDENFSIWHSVKSSSSSKAKLAGYYGIK